MPVWFKLKIKNGFNFNFSFPYFAKRARISLHYRELKLIYFLSIKYGSSNFCYPKSSLICYFYLKLKLNKFNSEILKKEDNSTIDLSVIVFSIATLGFIRKEKKEMDRR